ncbi:MAG: cytochrome c maturation protein CcmE [Candidatus Methanoperedens sp.]|nr:cytochrome c maturation protein CcmE [Candidatus Methanoperedens sp.]
MNKKNRLILGVSIIVVLLGSLFYYTNTSKIYEVSEAVAAQGNLTGKVITINGSMVPGSDNWDSLNRTLALKMTDGIATLDVVYIGDKPDLPPEATNIQAVVTGKFNNNVFEAFNMLTKCPSKYESNNSIYTPPAKTQ